MNSTTTVDEVAVSRAGVKNQIEALVQALNSVLLGKEQQIKLSLACLFAGGHLLIEDLPGMGKTLLSHALAKTLGLSYNRIQFTSDVLPSDIIGATIFDKQSNSFRFIEGPLFAQLILADEINRATPKSQSALLEAMEERQVTNDGVSMPLPTPFFVIATQNPSTQSGTFALPESQLDRFLMRIELGYPEPAAERQLLMHGDRRTHLNTLGAIISPAELSNIQAAVGAIKASDPVIDYIQRIIAFSRLGSEFAFGLSPRGALALLQSAKAWALINDRSHVVPEDVQAVLPSVVEHRLRESADFTGHGGGALAQKLLGSVDVVSQADSLNAFSKSASARNDPAKTAPPFSGKRFGAWLDRRIPPSARINLSQANIFIFPTRSGFAFAGLLLMLILGAINYQNSLVYGTAFLLGSMFVITILYTFRNLSGLSIEMAECHSGFVGEHIEFSVRVERPKGRGREGIQIGWPNGYKQWVEIYDTQASVVSLYVTAERRGWLHPGRMLVETYFPLGLLRAWTWVDINARGLVYPKPLFSDSPQSHSSKHRDEGVLIDPLGSDDFVDLRGYVPGDPIRNILWRSYARSDELVVKRYASYQEPRLWFDFDQLSGDVEEKLSRLTGFALTATRSEQEFGLRLPQKEIAPGLGQLHLDQVLRELALYGHSEAEQPNNG